MAGQAQDIVYRHSVAISGTRSLRRVNVGVGVDPNQNGVGVHFERGAHGPVANGVIAADGEHDRVHLINDCVVDVLRNEFAALNRVFELLVGPHVDVLHVVGIMLHDLVQGSRVTVLRATMRLALVAADRGEYKLRLRIILRTKNNR